MPQDEACLAGFTSTIVDTRLQDAFATDGRDALGVWRESRGLPLDPQEALRETGYIKRITKERAGRKTTSPSSYA